MLKPNLLSAFFSLLLFSLFPGPSAQAQNVSSDGTTASTVAIDSSNQQFVVNNGTIRENSLFHSFSDFSPQDWSVVFDLNGSIYDSIDLVVGRVTGQQGSMIDGSLALSGGLSPDLLLVNPWGIEFGPNASLQLPGSFLASTAESLIFKEYAFSAVQPSSVPLLSVSTPVGLQLGAKSQGIVYRGGGHSLAATSDPTFSPYLPTQAPSGLTVQPGESLSFLGNGIGIAGGTLNAPGGRVELVSLSDDTVDAAIAEGGFALSTRPGASKEGRFSDIGLSQRALLDVSGKIGEATGEITVRGAAVQLDDGAVIFVQNRSGMDSGDITVEASEHLTLKGQLTAGAVVSSIVSESISHGDSGNITIRTPELQLLEGSAVGTRVVGAGSGGDVTVKADVLTVDGYTAISPDLFTRLGTTTAGAGKAGDVSIYSRQLNITNGGYVGAATILAGGKGGDVMVQANDIMVDGATPNGVLSSILAVSIGGSGDSGTLKIDADRLSVNNSASIITSSFASGSAGNIDITATDWIQVGGQLPGFKESSIASDVRQASQSYQQQGASISPIGDAGRVNIKTRSLRIDEGSNISVANLGIGQAGALTVRTQEILLSGGDITAVTAAGRGGDISLSTTTLISSKDSRIQATSLSSGRGGNIVIQSPFIVGRGNSDIVANAQDGQGGNIDIVTQGIFGFRPRPQLTTQSDITASSALGVSGTVDINNTGLDINSGLVELPTHFSDVDNQVATSCSSAQDNQFMASGRGGLPLNPRDSISVGHLFQDVRSIPGSAPIEITPATGTARSAPDSFLALTDKLSEPQEATTWQRNDLGEVALVGPRSQMKPSSPACLSEERFL